MSFLTEAGVTFAAYPPAAQHDGPRRLVLLKVDQQPRRSGSPGSPELTDPLDSGSAVTTLLPINRTMTRKVAGLVAEALGLAGSGLFYVLALQDNRPFIIAVMDRATGLAACLTALAVGALLLSGPPRAEDSSVCHPRHPRGRCCASLARTGCGWVLDRPGSRGGCGSGRRRGTPCWEDEATANCVAGLGWCGNDGGPVPRGRRTGDCPRRAVLLKRTTIASILRMVGLTQHPDEYRSKRPILLA